MSFCRITGKSRGLPKPNYFPLLPPISPADAKRFCRITNKSQGLPGHHFIPALLSARGLRAHCRVTGKSEGQAPHHFPNVDSVLKAHDIIPGYKYVFPKFDEDKKLHGRILSLISSKTQAGESNSRFVYTVEERQTGLVIPAGLEAAVRDGDIRDLMLDKEKDMMLVKLHQGPSVTIDVTDLVMDEGMLLWEGLGPSQSVLKQWEKEEREMEMQKKKRKEGLHKRKQIFEDKEKAADEEESELARIKDARKSKIVKVKMRTGSEDVDVMVDSGPTPIHNPLKDISSEPVFGHIVQTATAVEFFPGDSILNLPEGKVVPGQLVRNAEGVKFVPGIMSDGRFVPGQVVKTNSGEQFVPGQVVDTRVGPKFVPGHVVETVSGPKFVPGQTIETEDGPQFVPGQIIETKAGPTFIPGQIIVTDDEPRFVPGRVVETAEGPRFVPGRVIESGNQVTFISGQVVETSEGLKFVAPDLEYMPEGGHEFSVQGFEVSPEELKLLRPAASCDAATCGVFTVDSKMLRQLSEAGMAVGRQVPAKLPDVDISALPLVVEKLKLNGAQALKMSHVMTVLSQVALKISQRSDLCASEIPLDEDAGDKLLLAVKKNKDLGKYLQAIVASSVVAARNNFDEDSFVTAVSSALETALASQLDSAVTKESILSVIGDVINSQFPAEKTETRERLLADISTAMETEMKTQLQHTVTEESMMKILNTVLESKLGKDNSTTTKAMLMEVVKSAIDKEQSAMYKENLNKESFLAVIASVMDSGVLEQASDLLSKESLLKEIRSELKNGEMSECDWSFTEEAVLPIIKSAIEKEVSAKGVTLNNGSLPAAIMASIKKELSLMKECALSEEKILECLRSVVEKELPEEISASVSKKELLEAVSSAVAAEKSLARQKALSEDALLATAYAALEKTVSARSEDIPDGQKLVEEAVAKIKEEVAVKHENAEVKKAVLANIEKAVERKILETCDNFLTEEMALAAMNAVVENGIQDKHGVILPKEKVPLLMKAVFEKEKLMNNASVMTKEKLVAALHDVMKEEGMLKNGSVMSAAAEAKILKACDSILNEDMALAVISSAVEDGVLLKMGVSLPKEKEKLTQIFRSVYEKEKLVNGSPVMTKEKLIATLHDIIQENGLFSNETVKKAFGAAVESKLTNASEATLSAEGAIATIQSVIGGEVLQKAGMSLTKDTIPSVVKSVFANEKLNSHSSVMTKDKLLSALRDVIEEEEIFGNEEVRAAFDAAVESTISATSGTVLNAEVALATINAVIESEIQQKLGLSLPEEKEKLNLIIKSAFEKEKSTNSTSLMTKEKLLAVLQDTVEREEIFSNEQVKAAFKSAVEKKISSTSGIILDKEIALAAVSSVIESEIERKPGLTLPKDKIPSIIKSVFEKEKLTNNSSVMNKEKLLSALQDAVEQEGLFSSASVMTAFNAAVEEKRKTKYENRLSDEIVMSAVDSAINAVISNEKDLKISRASLLSAVTSELKKIKSSSPVSEGRILAAVHSAITEELTSEQNPVKELLLEKFDSAVEDTLMSTCQNLLTETELLSTLDSAIESGLSRIPDCALSKTDLMSKINSAIEDKKMKKRQKILSEKVLLECIQSAIAAEVAAAGENPSLAESVFSSVNSAIKKEKDAKRFMALTEEAIVQAMSSAMDSKLIQNNKITLTKGELVKMVSEAIQERKTDNPEIVLTEEALVKIVQSTIENKVSDESEAHLILKAFGSAIDEEKTAAGKEPIPEKAFLEIVESAIGDQLPVNASISKDKLMSAIAKNVDGEVTKRGPLVTEEVIVAAAYSAIEREASEKGESASVKELLSGIDSVVERKRDSRRVVNEEIILEAINAIADEFTESPESKAAVLRAVTSAVGKAKLINGESALTNEELIGIASGVVQEHFADNSKDVFMTAIGSAIAKEQVAKRDTLMTKELLSAAVSSAVEDQLSQNPGLLPVKETLLKAANTAVESECTESVSDKRLTEKALLAAIGSSMEDVLGELPDTAALEKVVNSMQRYLSENLDEVIVGTVNYMVANESPMDKLKYAVSNAGNTMQVIEKLSSVLNDNMGEAFQKLSAGDPSLLKNVIDMLNVDELTSKDQATEALQRAIVGAVRQRSVDTLRTLMENSRDAPEGKDFKELLLQSVGLAKALGMKQVASVLLDVVSDSRSHEVLANDETVIDVLQRLTIMRQFAETKPELASALTQLISDPELAKRDPGIRELVRHSTALMTVPEETLHSSADIPFSLLMSDNTLAMEQFLARARRPRTLVIVKSGLQAVVPKEAARAVLTGQVPYAVLDEKGIKYFEPLHVFSTMKLPYYAAHCFSMYRCPEMECESETATPTLTTPRGSFSSAEDCFNQRKTVIMNGHWDKHREHGSKRFDKHFPVSRRVSELSKKPNYTFNNKPCPLVYRTHSASRIADFGKKPECAFLSDVYN